MVTVELEEAAGKVRKMKKKLKKDVEEGDEEKEDKMKMMKEDVGVVCMWMRMDESKSGAVRMSMNDKA